jgi:hypothetical protein
MASIFDMLGDTKDSTSKSIVGSLFGLSPDLVAQQQAQSALQSSQNSAMQFAQLDPMQRAQYAIFQGGAGAAGGLMGALGPKSAAVQRAEQEAALRQKMGEMGIRLDNPQGYMQGAKLAMDMGLTDIAAKMGMAGAQLDKEMANAEKARREDTGELVNRDLYALALQEAGGDRMLAAKIYNDRKQAEKRSVAAAGAAQYGQEKITNLSGAQGIVEKYTKQPFERLQAIDEAKGFLGMAKEGNTAAVPQLRRALVRLGGPDSQLAAKEIASIAGNAGIAGNVANAVNSFFTGTPTREEIKLIGKVIAGAESVIADQYNQGRQQAETVLGAAKLDPQTRQALLPPAFKKAEKTYPNAPKVGTIVDGYRYNGGNPADQNSWSKQ